MVIRVGNSLSIERQTDKEGKGYKPEELIRRC